MTEVGKPDAIPEIEIVPLEDPVPRVTPLEIPVEPEVPSHEPVRVPELVPA